MLTFNDKNISYDNNGNMTSVTNTCGTTTFTWDARNRLVGISGFDALCSPLSAAFQYDAVGRRIGKTVNGVTTQYVYDGLDIIQEKQNGTVTTNYVRTMNIDEPLARLATNTARFYQTDALGSVIALTDESGTVRTTYSYDPFGNSTVSGESSDNPFQYTGRENDGTGLYYYRARYYAPELQRFISEDPIGLKGGINKFVYTENSPVNFSDPSGLLLGGSGAAISAQRSCKCSKWQMVEWRRVANAVCQCCWLCVPPGGVIWSGNSTGLPCTMGVLINDPLGGGGEKRGNSCLCKEPE